MKILAFDTSTEWCSVAVGDGNDWHHRDEHVGQGHAERLLVMVDDALRAAGWALRNVDGIAFGAGGTEKVYVLLSHDWFFSKHS
jgi:tRNA threonylcarbamoyladenosine biosynthesis protein TsaB